MQFTTDTSSSIAKPGNQQLKYMCKCAYVISMILWKLQLRVLTNNRICSPCGDYILTLLIGEGIGHSIPTPFELDLAPTRSCIPPPILTSVAAWKWRRSNPLSIAHEIKLKKLQPSLKGLWLKRAGHSGNVWLQERRW